MKQAHEITLMLNSIIIIIIGQLGSAVEVAVIRLSSPYWREVPVHFLMLPTLLFYFLTARKGHLELRKQNIVKISIIYILQGFPKISDFQNAAKAQKS